MLRILIVEDDSARSQTLRSWLPAEVRSVVANTAGSAIGILRLDAGHVYAGILLDHDLQQKRHSEADALLCGQDVVEAVVQYVDRSVRILVHSVNSIGRHAMATRLRTAGFSVDVIPMNQMTVEDLTAWIAEIQSASEDS